MNVSPFISSNCGTANGTATPDPSNPNKPPGLAINTELSINGNTDLSACIIGRTGAHGGKVYSIQLVKKANPIPWAYEIQVIGEAPQTTGSLYLFFTDATGDTYKLWIWRHTQEQHTVDYNSSSPTIVKIVWSDKDSA